MARKRQTRQSEPAQAQTLEPVTATEPQDAAPEFTGAGVSAVTDAPLDASAAPDEGAGVSATGGYLAGLQARRVELDNECSLVQGQIAQLQARERELFAEIDRVQRKIDRHAPADDNAKAIQAYLQQQTLNRQANAERLNDLYALGVQPSELAPRRSPIDLAVASKKHLRQH